MTLLIPKLWLAAAAILCALPAQDGPALRIIPGAWPRRPRIVGYEYHMKDRRNMPTEGTGESRVDVLPPVRGSYRLIGVEVSNPTSKPLVGTLTSRQLKRSRWLEVEVPPGDRIRRYFAVKARPKVISIDFKLVGSRKATLAEASAPFAKDARLTTRGEARRMARELAYEEKVRERLKVHPISVVVRDEKGRPVDEARLTLFHEETGWLETPVTDGEGRWRGRLLEGKWNVLARKIFPLPPVDPQSTVIPPTRILYLAAAAAVGEAEEVILSPGAATPIRVENADGAALPLDRLWLAPRGLAGPLAYADVARKARGAFLLDVKRRMEQGGIELLGSPGLTYEIGAFKQPGVMPGAILVGEQEATGEPIRLKLDPKRMGRLKWDLSRAPQGTETIGAAVSLPESIRLEMSFLVSGQAILHVPAGPVRTRVNFATKAGERLDFAPHMITLAPGGEADLTPRFPLSFTPYVARSQGLQVWLALRDPLGRIVQGLKAEGKVKAAHRGELLFEAPLSDLRYQFPSGMDQVELSRISFAAELEFGQRTMQWKSRARERDKMQGERAEVVAPAALADHARPYLEISRKSLVGSERVMGRPENIKRISNRFEVFLPPDVGGLGGGGAIMLDLFDLVRFCAPTDSLPWAYRHEFGHNLGFGHDPYMFMAPCGIDDELFGPTGYRMLNGGTLPRLRAYLDRPRPDPPGHWNPSGDVFAAIGLLYGPGIHRKMFDARKQAEGVLEDVGLSVIERIAAQYTLAAGESLTWIFRAFDWPVFDERVLRGLYALEQRDFRKQGKVPTQIDGLVVRDWWIQGPITLRKAKEKPGSPPPPPAPWRYLFWQEDFIDLPEGPPERGRVAYRLFHRVQAAARLEALLVCGSDVQLDVAVNGQTVSRIHASPQLRQPRHDDYRLEEWAQTVIPVVFEKGENLLEAVVIQPSGSKGFFLEIAGRDGKALPEVRLRRSGPGEVEGDRNRPKPLEARPPVHNPSFEEGKARPGPWVMGPVEPRGGIEWKWEDRSAARGKRCARLLAKGPARGALIQRVVVEPDSEYILSGAIQADGLSGKDCEAYICVFHQDPFGRLLAQTESIEAGSTRWKVLETPFFSRKRRVAYVGCVVKGAEGAVWFDEVRLTKKP